LVVLLGPKCSSAVVNRHTVTALPIYPIDGSPG